MGVWSTILAMSPGPRDGPGLEMVIESRITSACDFVVYRVCLNKCKSTKQQFRKKIEIVSFKLVYKPPQDVDLNILCHGMVL